MILCLRLSSKRYLGDGGVIGTRSESELDLESKLVGAVAIELDLLKRIIKMSQTCKQTNKQLEKAGHCLDLLDLGRRCVARGDVILPIYLST